MSIATPLNIPFPSLQSFPSKIVCRTTVLELLFLLTSFLVRWSLVLWWDLPRNFAFSYYTHKHTYPHTHMYCTHIYIPTYPHTHMYCTHIYIPTCTHKHIYMYTHIHILYTHAHTYKLKHLALLAVPPLLSNSMALATLPYSLNSPTPRHLLRGEGHTLSFHWWATPSHFIGGPLSLISLVGHSLSFHWWATPYHFIGGPHPLISLVGHSLSFHWWATPSHFIGGPLSLVSLVGHLPFIFLVGHLTTPLHQYSPW